MVLAHGHPDHHAHDPQGIPVGKRLLKYQGIDCRGAGRNLLPYHDMPLRRASKRKGQRMNARQHAKVLLKEAFPSIWLRWHLMHHPKTAEQELHYLDRIVPEGAVTVDVGANCGLYTRKLAQLSKRVY